MKINNNISFGKTLVATCQLQTTDKKNSACNIFELNSTEDKDYFEKLKTDPHWNGSKFLRSMDCLMKTGSIGNTNDTFSLEDSNGKCLGYVSVITHEQPHNKKFIYSLETAPEHSAKNEKRATKNISHSLVAFIVEQAKKENRDQVTTLAFDSDTRKIFKRQCHFKYGEESSYDCVLPQKQFTKFLENHKKTTGNEITLIK